MVDPIVDEGAGVSTLNEFASWMQSEQRRVYLLCFRLLRDEDEANSATQDSFFKAYKALGKTEFEAVEDATRWITRIAVNTCLDRLRSKRWQFWRKRPPQETEETILHLAASTDPGALDRICGREIERRLAVAVEKLSLRQRAVFTLRHYEDKSLEDIARTLDLDVGSVKSHLSRALVKMRCELKDLYGNRL
ncbi:MAG: RNA polymerase sigma factor [Bryobacteraceae bacterium]